MPEGVIADHQTMLLDLGSSDLFAQRSSPPQTIICNSVDYDGYMGQIEEIKRTIEELSADDFDAVAKWILERQQSRWDAELDEDYASGRLSFLRNEANPAPGQPLREWP